MIDIGGKETVLREAIARGEIILKKSTVSSIKNRKIKKGDILEISKVSGILAAKNTFQNIPHCHQIPLDSVNPELNFGDRKVEVKCTVRANYKTGVEIEALSCVSAMLLTIWDMVKYLEKDNDGNYPDTKISEIRVIEKRKISDGP